MNRMNTRDQVKERGDSEVKVYLFHVERSAMSVFVKEEQQPKVIAFYGPVLFLCVCVHERSTVLHIRHPNFKKRTRRKV